VLAERGREANELAEQIVQGVSSGGETDKITEIPHESEKTVSNPLLKDQSNVFSLVKNVLNGNGQLLGSSDNSAKKRKMQLTKEVEVSIGGLKEVTSSEMAKKSMKHSEFISVDENDIE